MWKLIWVAHAINVSLALVITTFVVYHHIHHPLVGTVTEFHAVIVWLKTASYALTNRDLRHAYLHPARGELDALPEIYKTCPYPKNVTMGNLVYFWWAPTLVYQPAYPRTEKIRWVFLFKRLGEALCLSVFIRASPAPSTRRRSCETRWTRLPRWTFTSILERLLKLSTISRYLAGGFFRPISVVPERVGRADTVW